MRGDDMKQKMQYIQTLKQTLKLNQKLLKSLDFLTDNIDDINKVIQDILETNPFLELKSSIFILKASETFSFIMFTVISSLFGLDIISFKASVASSSEMFLFVREEYATTLVRAPSNSLMFDLMYLAM